MSLSLLTLASFFLGAPPSEPEEKALAYLSVEVPRWSAENHCYSCHNNGDAARALFLAIQLGRSVPSKATLDTERWLIQPEKWEKNGGTGPFSDKRLARVQFASALAAAVKAGRVTDRSVLAGVARTLANDQAENGSWPIEEPGRVGSPATYGSALATWIAAETLRTADPAQFGPRIARAEVWLRAQPVETVMDASTILLARAYDATESGQTRRRHALEILANGQSRDGGWGLMLWYHRRHSTPLWRFWLSMASAIRRGLSPGSTRA